MKRSPAAVPTPPIRPIQLTSPINHLGGLSTQIDASCYRDAARAGFHPRRIVSRMVS
jgi:hypothetical protein